MSDFPDNLKADIDGVPIEVAENSLLIRIGHLAKTADVEQVEQLAWAYAKITQPDPDKAPEQSEPEPSESE